MSPVPGREGEEAGFTEFRRKVRTAEVLSAAMERLLAQIQFNGKVSIIIQHGRVLKSGYERVTSAILRLDRARAKFHPKLNNSGRSS